MVKTDDDKAEFIPSSVMDDKHGGNKIGMAAVFGEDFVKNLLLLVSTTSRTQLTATKNTSRSLKTKLHTLP